MGMADASHTFPDMAGVLAWRARMQLCAAHVTWPNKLLWRTLPT
jgi:hypothetical protein